MDKLILRDVSRMKINLYGIWQRETNKEGRKQSEVGIYKRKQESKKTNNTLSTKKVIKKKKSKHGVIKQVTPHINFMATHRLIFNSS